jgi:ParB-like chromosome segregation protein Spo0J
MELVEKMIDILLEAEKLDLYERVEFINEARRMLHKISPLKNEPVDVVQWVKSYEVIANDYNPNRVAPPEMKLLELSIKEDGYTQPIVTYYDEIKQKYIIVDGFHRSRVGQEVAEINKRVDGYLPIVVIDKPIGDRIASTIRHNRARGTHDIDLMSDLVAELHRLGKTDHWISKNLGMDADEVMRLKQIGGLADLFRDKDFSRSWDVVDECVNISDEIEELKMDIQIKDGKAKISDEQLEELVRNWDPEKDSVGELRDAFEAWGSFKNAFEIPSLEEAIVHLPISNEFEEFIEDLSVKKRQSIITCDNDGFCLLDDGAAIKHISEI